MHQQVQNQLVVKPKTNQLKLTKAQTLSIQNSNQTSQSHTRDELNKTPSQTLLVGKLGKN